MTTTIFGNSCRPSSGGGKSGDRIASLLPMKAAAEEAALNNKPGLEVLYQEEILNADITLLDAEVDIQQYKNDLETSQNYSVKLKHARSTIENPNLNKADKEQALLPLNPNPTHRTVEMVVVQELDVNNSLDENTIEVLNTIGNGCIEEHGSAIYEAQTILSYYTGQGISEIGSCSSMNKYGSTKEKSKEITSYGLNPEIGKKINIYPNPNNGNFTIEIPIISETTLISIKINDVTGKIVYTKEIDSIESNQIILNSKELVNGIYFIQISCNEDIYFDKLEVIK